MKTKDQGGLWHGGETACLLFAFGLKDKMLNEHVLGEAKVHRRFTDSIFDGIVFKRRMREG